jgi:predicted DNA-binding transcriptional regulator YafY
VAVFPQLERILWFNAQLKEGRYPNAFHLAERFEFSYKTAQRDIDLLRDRFQAPLEYHPSRKGYHYTDDHFELPCLPASQQEVLCLVLARSLLTHAAGGYITREIDSLLEKLFCAAAGIGLKRETADRLFSATWSGYTPAQEETFRQVAWALVKQRLVAFTYHSPLSENATARRVEPHHLQHYMASWVLTAWCHNRCDWRKFYLARMSEVSVLDQTFDPKPESAWRHLLEGAFGLFQGDQTVPVTLRFNAFRARWIRQQHWHPDQQITEKPDGGLDLTLPMADFREIKLKILQFDADAEVLAPDSLRKEIEQEIDRMKSKYETKRA